MSYSFTVGRTQHLTYTGEKVCKTLEDYAEQVVFEEYGLRPGQGGDAYYRSNRGPYHVAILTGRGQYSVVLSYNLGLANKPGEDSDHRGYLVLELELVGASLADAFRAAAKMIDNLVTSAGYPPLGKLDNKLFAVGEAYWAEEAKRKREAA